jgi:hypothetical protein
MDHFEKLDINKAEDIFDSNFKELKSKLSKKLPPIIKAHLFNDFED